MKLLAVAVIALLLLHPVAAQLLDENEVDQVVQAGRQQLENLIGNNQKHINDLRHAVKQLSPTVSSQ